MWGSFNEATVRRLATIAPDVPRVFSSAGILRLLLAYPPHRFATLCASALKRLLQLLHRRSALHFPARPPIQVSFTSPHHKPETPFDNSTACRRPLSQAATCTPHGRSTPTPKVLIPNNPILKAGAAAALALCHALCAVAHRLSRHVPPPSGEPCLLVTTPAASCFFNSVRGRLGVCA